MGRFLSQGYLSGRLADSNLRPSGHGAAFLTTRLPTASLIYVNKMIVSYNKLPSLLTIWNESRYKAGNSGDNVGCCKRQPSADAVNCEQDKDGSREFHDARDQEVNIDVSTQDPQTHDQTLIHHSTCEPASQTHISHTRLCVPHIISMLWFLDVPVVAEDEGVLSHLGGPD